MKPYISLLVIAVAVCGCDGHIHSFKPVLPTGKTGADGAVDRQKIVDAVTAVASERGYESTGSSQNTNTLPRFSKQLEHGHIEVRVMADKTSGEYHIELLDWPSTAQC
jgi:hypothetical protein